jgi:hypothetical protein
MEGPTEEVLKVYMLGSFLDRYYGSDRQTEVPCYICRVRKDGPLMIPEHEASEVLRLFLGQSFPSLRSRPAESETAASDKKVQAYEKVYNIGNRWICAECILKRIMEPSRPHRHSPHPLQVELNDGGLQETDSISTPPEMHVNSIFQKIDRVIKIKGEKSQESIENAVGHLSYYLKNRFGQEEGPCDSCVDAFNDSHPTAVYRIGTQALCIDCILERIDSLDRTLYPT